MEGLLDQHYQMLKRSAISDHVIEARGYRSVQGPELAAYGFARSQQRKGLLIPLWGMDQSVVGYQLRPDWPRLSMKGNYVKYESLWRKPNVLDINPLMQPELRKGLRVIFICEGCKKGDALASVGMPAISISGVWNWKGKNNEGGTTSLADWNDVNIKGSHFVIAFDSDILTNRGVNAAARELKAWLLYKKADSVLILVLPSINGEKIGVDDYLASIQKGSVLA